jgi:ABC-2 type transport system permease protein
MLEGGLNMRIAWYAAYYELLQFMRLRSVVLILFGLPLVLIFILGNGLSTSSMRSIDVAVWNGDESLYGLTFDEYAATENVREHIRVRPAESEEEVRERLLTGQADYGIVIPAGYAAASPVTATPIAVFPGELPDRNLKAEAILGGFLAQVEQRRATALVFGERREQSPASRPSQDASYPSSEGSNVAVNTLYTGSSLQFGSVSSLQYYAAAYLVMFLMFSGMSAAISTIEQREQGTLRRLRALPITMTHFMLGKYAGFALLAMLQSAVIVLVTRYAFGVQWGNAYGWTLAVCLLTALSAIALSVTLASFLPSRKSVESIFTMAVIVMTFLSGGMIPTLHPMLREAGKVTINHWANEALKSLMTGGSWTDIRTTFLMLTAIAFALSAMMLLRIGRTVMPR